MMPERRHAAIPVLSIALALFSLAGCGSMESSSRSQTGPATIPEVTLNISAAASVNDDLEEINRLYTQSHPDTTLLVNFASSGTLQRQIEQGAPCDVFISAGAPQMDNLQAQGLIQDGTRREVLGNALVLVVPSDNPFDIDSFTYLASDEIRSVAIGDPGSVPAGVYARQAFEMLGIAAQVESKEILAGDVRQVLTYVATGDADAGIVYRTDALTSRNVRVAADAPDAINSRISYPAAVIRASRSQNAAREYIAFLSSPQAGAVFERHGFTVASR
jgi:molybdate transport system substrate-binding protein